MNVYNIFKVFASLLTPQPDDPVFYDNYYSYDTNLPEWTFDHLCAESDVIVRVTATEQTEPVYRGWKTQVTVSRVLKGECPESIFILEACGMNYVTDENPQWQNMYYYEDGYVLMQPNREYVFFLKYVNGDVYTTTASGLAKFSVCEEPFINDTESSAQTTYSEYLTYDYCTPDSEAAEHYRSLHRQVQSLLQSTP